MAILETTALVATIASGILAITVMLSAVVDFFTGGWVRDRFRQYLGMTSLHEDIMDTRDDLHDTQTFIHDLGKAQNELNETVCEEHDIPEEERPHRVDVGYYRRRLDDGGPAERGDFLRDTD